MIEDRTRQGQPSGEERTVRLDTPEPTFALQEVSATPRWTWYLTELALNGMVREPASSGEALADADDRHLWALLEGAEAAVLVTGDHALRRRAPEPTRVVSPREFLARLTRGGGGTAPNP